MLKVGIVGMGFMGWIHWLAYQRVQNVQVVAIASRDPKKRGGDWRTIKGNFGPPGEIVDLHGVSAYENYQQLLNDSNVDMIDICLPPAEHVGIAIAAAQKGKHVFCEKPLALNVLAARNIVEACAQNRRLLAVGHVLPFFPEYHWALQQIHSGSYGKLLGGNFKRVISNPTWIPDFYDVNKIGGPLIDLHVHDAHLIRILFGMPSSVYSRGRMNGGTVEYAQSQFLFPDTKLVVSSTMGVVHQQGRPFTHGFEIHLERATLQFEFAAFADAGETMPIKLIDNDGKVVRPEAKPSDAIDGFVAEITDVVKSIQTGLPSKLLSGDLACDAIKICTAQAESIASSTFAPIC